MKRIMSLLSLYLFFFPLSFAQQKIGVVDIESTIAGWNKEVKLDIMLDQKSNTLKKMVETWLDKLQLKFDQYDNKTGTPSQQDILAKQILDGQEEILEFEKILVDSIPRYRKEVLQLIQNKIQKTIDAVAIANDYDLIVAKDKILFYRGEEMDELIVTYSSIDLKDIQILVDSMDEKLNAWIEAYTSRIEQY